MIKSWLRDYFSILKSMVIISAVLLQKLDPEGLIEKYLAVFDNN